MVRRLRGILAWSAVCALSALAPLSSHAQAIFGSIYGTVTDNTGAVLPGATVTITDESKGTSVTATTNASGAYVVEHLIPDAYDVTVAAAGFQKFETKGVQVLADTSPKVDAQLTIGGSTQTITVSADSIPQLKTDRADVATEFTAKQLSDLPIPDRNFTNIQLLLPGAQELNWAHASDEDPQGSKQIQVDGQAFGGVAFMLDGTDNQDPILGIIVINPPMDALSDTKITTQNFDAELGKAVSSVITAQTRSGTNSFHGSLFDYRESAANLARDAFQQQTGPIPSALKNQFGGSLGGPIFKDKLFFFGDYQGVRQKAGVADTMTVPSAHLVSTCLGETTSASGIAGCDFSEYVANVPNTPAIYHTVTNADGTTSQAAFPSAVVPAAYLSPQALALFRLLQPYAPNVAGQYNGLSANYSASGTGLFNDDQWDERVDSQLNDKMHAFERFSRFTNVLSGTTIFGAAGGAGFGLNGYGGHSVGAMDSLAAGMDIALSPKWVTDFRVGYYRYNIGDVKYDQGIDFASQLGIPGMNTGSYDTSGAPQFDIADANIKGANGPNNGTDLGSQYGSGLNLNRCNCPLTEREDQFQVVNNWTRIMGNHAIKFGADLRYARNLRVPSDTDRTGIVNFGSGPTSDGNGNSGLGFATFVQGQVTSYSRYVSTSTNAKEFQKRLFFYGQDTWHASPKLTVSYGLRYEAYFPEVVNGKGNGGLMNLSTGYISVAGYGDIGSNMNWSPAKWAFNPRLGVAYQLNDKTVIRSGYGRSFDIGVFGSIFGHTVTQNLPVLATQSLNSASGTGYAFCLGPTDTGCTQPAGQPAVGGPVPYPFPAVPSNGLLPNPGSQVTTKARPDPLRLPTLDAWNLSIQHAITPTLSFTLAYVGNKGTHTLSSGDGNSTNPNEAAIFLPAGYSVENRPLHFTTTAAEGSATPDANGIYPDGGVANNNNLLQRYYGGKLAACQDPNYTTPDEVGITPGMCGWVPSIQYNGSDQDTHFNALQATLAKQLSRGLSFNVQYAWQRGFNWNSGFVTWDRSAVKVRDAEIREQQIVIYGNYQLPFGRNQLFAANAPRFVDEIIGGWMFSPVLDWAGGLPFTLGFAECGSLIPGTAPCYVNGRGSNLKHSTGTYSAATNSRRYFTGTATPLTTAGYQGFTAPGLDQLGNGGGNNVYGPGFFNGDLALQKNFPIYESWLAQFRVDAFNGFNHMSPGNPGNTNIDGGSSAGLITTCQGINGSCNPRQLQFSLRVQF